MPSLSIDSKDLNSLGLNLKDILKAISSRKSSKNEIKVPRMRNTVVGRIDKLNPFPSYNPKLNPYQYQGVGGGNGLGSHTRVEIRSEPQQQQQHNKQADIIKKQLEIHQTKLEKQINDIQALQQENIHGLQTAELALKYLYNQSLPSPANLSTNNYNLNSFRPISIDTTDRFGVAATNNYEEIPEQTEIEDKN
jgi:hypothetical protein